MKVKSLFAIGLVALTGAPQLANGGSLTPNQESDTSPKFHWIADRRIILPLSGGTFAIPHNWAAIVGSDARKLDVSSNGSNSDTEYIEAVAGTETPGETSSIIQVDFEYLDSGYVSDSDWSDLNPDSLLQDVTENTERHNADMQRAGLGELHIVGWLQPPAFDSQNHVASWAIEDRDQNDTRSLNMTAIKLGRNGYERIIVITDRDNFGIAKNDLPIILDSFSFAGGRTYSDHVDGDRVAGYGIAGL
jgi:uncharacterized membrane-anchored protein